MPFASAKNPRQTCIGLVGDDTSLLFTESTATCPICGYQKQETMPKDPCCGHGPRAQFFRKRPLDS